VTKTKLHFTLSLCAGYRSHIVASYGVARSAGCECRGRYPTVGDQNIAINGDPGLKQPWAAIRERFQRCQTHLLPRGGTDFIASQS
jgi:hypothetical protein